MKQRLSEKEEVIMQICWDLKKAFVKEVREALPEPKLHINTVSTMMRRLADKGFLEIEDFGTTYRYSPTLAKNDYVTRFVRPLLAGLFGNSMKNAISFFAEQEDVTAEELREVLDMIEKRRK
jgi:BlaI family transcriptional regulator, penicillinase repressor